MWLPPERRLAAGAIPDALPPGFARNSSYGSGIAHGPLSTVFLLSPANLNGQRGRIVLNPKAEFPLARALRSPEGALLGELFSFVSGLYFRGKMTYAGVFGSASEASAFVISQGEGLRALSERVTVERLRRWGSTPIDADNPRFTEPLLEDAATLELVHDRETRFVL